MQILFHLAQNGVWKSTFVAIFQGLLILVLNRQLFEYKEFKSN